jgi:UDP-N-acetyl-D-glucosamine dehydrogenase
MKICIVGLGYVGLPLAIQFARANVTVLGLDVDQAKVQLINQRQSYIKHIPQVIIQSVVNEQRLCASTDSRYWIVTGWERRG